MAVIRNASDKPKDYKPQNFVLRPRVEQPAPQEITQEISDAKAEADLHNLNQMTGLGDDFYDSL